jgi:3-oxoacyl-[acyl-carrier-protein] synthase-3
LIYSRIIGTGSYLPAKVLTNYDLEKIVDTSHDWIFTRSGIVERHFAADDENTSDLALHASRKAIEAAGIKADEIDMIIVATTSPDMVFPSTACILQDKLGIRNGGAAFDMQAVCGGFVYALNTADLYIRGGQARTVLVVGAEVLSRILDWNDRTTCVLARIRQTRHRDCQTAFRRPISQFVESRPEDSYGRQGSIQVRRQCVERRRG